MNLITDDIYIGNLQDALLTRISGKCIVFTVAKDSPVKGQYYYPIVDGEDPNNEEELGYAIADLITVRRTIAGCILVHCIGGMSRSPAVVTGYMMEVHQMTLSAAYKYVKARRPQAMINPALLDLLKKLDADYPYTVW